ncbi:hypothetical protein HDU98_003396, partial [Podochytrium sp. JEL0797]
DVSFGAVSDRLAAKGFASVQQRTNLNTALARLLSFDLDKCDKEGVKDALSDLKGLKDIHQVQPRQRPDVFTRFSETPPQTPDAIHSLTNVVTARELLNATGAGIRVALIDSGVYYLHPALGGCFGDQCKVAFGKDLVGDAYDGVNGLLKPDNDPLDNCSSESHGTHVAGIVAGVGQGSVEWTGVATDVELGAYRVFGCNGSTATDIITAAIYLAAEAGADIINLSLGGGPAFADEPDAIAAAEVSKLGHFVVAAVGNDGLSGMFVTGDPANSEGVVGVASFDNVDTEFSMASIDNQEFAYTTAKDNGTIADGETWEVIVNDPNAEKNNILNDGCVPPANSINATGKALLIRWGDATQGGSAKRCQYAFSTGAIACILYGNTPDMIGILGVSSIPGIFLHQSGGRALLHLLQTNQPARITLTYSLTLEPIPTAGTLSSFSSPGLNMELLMKPDIAAIGGLVYSCLSPFASHSQGLHEPYGVLSGTSMATPYLAGVAALVLQIRGPLPFNHLRGLLQNTALPANVYNTSHLHNPAYQGSGLVNAYAAASITTLVIPSSFSFNDSIRIHDNYTFQVFNFATETIHFSLNSTASVTPEPFLPGDDYTQDQNSTHFSTNTFYHAEIEFLTPLTISIPPYSQSQITFRVHPPPSTPECRIYGGYITLTSPLSTTHIPFTGVAGDWSTRPIWVHSSHSLSSRVFSPPRFNTTSTSVATGVYPDTRLLPITQYQTLNASLGVMVLPLAARTSRNASVQAWGYTKAGEFVSLGELNLYDIGPHDPPQLVTQRVGVWTPMQRTGFIDGQSVAGAVGYIWDGQVWNAGKVRKVEDGALVWVKFVGERPFGGEVDVVWSGGFDVVF